MTANEYRIKLDNLEQEFQKQKNSLAVEYAKAHQLFNDGATISDSVGKIVVDKIKYTLGGVSSMPEAVYYGIELKKDGTPRKDGSKRSIYQSQIKP